jgi:hypothetical protein
MERMTLVVKSVYIRIRLLLSLVGSDVTIVYVCFLLCIYQQSVKDNGHADLGVKAPLRDYFGVTKTLSVKERDKLPPLHHTSRTAMDF